LLGRRGRVEHYVAFDADVLDQIKLALEEIDMFLFAPQYFQQQVAGDKIAHTLAICDAFAQISQRLFLQCQVGLAWLRPSSAAPASRRSRGGMRSAAGCCGTPRLTDLLAPSRRHRATLAFAWGLVRTLAVVAAVMPIITLSQASNAVEARIAELQPQIAAVESLRRRVAGGSAGSSVIAAERGRVGHAVQVLATTTDLIPDETVLSDLSLHQGKLSISGQSATAPRLIPATRRERRRRGASPGSCRPGESHQSRVYVA
jgi:hypothetical protein